MSDEELETLIQKRIDIADAKTESSDNVVHLAWLVQGLDLWHRSNGKMGHSPAEAQRFIISQATRLIESEKAHALTAYKKELLSKAVNYYLGCEEHCPDGSKHVQAIPVSAIDVKQ